METLNSIRSHNKKHERFLETSENNFKIRLIVFVQKLVLKHAQLIVTPSLYLSKIITTHYTQRKQILINYNPAEKAEILPFSENLMPHQIITIAKLFEWKKIAGIIRSVALLKKEFPDMRLIVAGEGSEETNLKILAQELNITDSIIFLGQISRAEMWHLRKSSQVCVINSSHEDVPDDAIKCFVTKTPIIATNAKSVNEVIQNERSGLLVKLGDDKDLASAIKRIFQNSDLRTHLVNEAQQILEEKFSWSAHIRLLDNSLKSILSKNNAQ